MPLKISNNISASLNDPKEKLTLCPSTIVQVSHLRIYAAPIGLLQKVLRTSLLWALNIYNWGQIFQSLLGAELLKT